MCILYILTFYSLYYIDIVTGSQCHFTTTGGRLVMSSDNILSARKPLDGVMLLDTLLQSPKSGTNSLVNIEIRTQEVGV